MSNQNKKIIHIDDSASHFVEKYISHNKLKTVGLVITDLLFKPIEILFIKPFKKIPDSENSYTTKAKMEWFKAKNIPMTNSIYKNLRVYTDEDSYKKGLSRTFSSYASYQIIKDSVDQAHDYSNDPNIVKIPKPLTRKEQKQLGRKKGN